MVVLNFPPSTVNINIQIYFEKTNVFIYVQKIIFKISK